LEDRKNHVRINKNVGMYLIYDARHVSKNNFHQERWKSKDWKAK